MSELHTTETERQKYARIWAEPAYRVNSPGHNLAAVAVDFLGAHPGQSVIDYGSGPAGLALDVFRERGLESQGVDLISERPEVRAACLWELPEDLGPSDYAYSADVLEHIPPEHVHAVLAGIRERTKVAGLFQIALTPDGHGALIGLPLHLTVQPSYWWRGQLFEHWGSVEELRSAFSWRSLFLVRP